MSLRPAILRGDRPAWLDAPAVVYRMFDANGDLLYIGCTADMMARLFHHRSAKPWFGDVVELHIEPYATRAEALVVERRAIETEKARYNVTPSEQGRRANARRNEIREADHAAGRPCSWIVCPLCKEDDRSSVLDIFNEFFGEAS